MAISTTINGKTVSLTSDPDTPLLWAIRDDLKLTGTKFGCGMAECGACTIFVDGVPQRSCVTPIESIEGAEITTIEAIDSKEAKAIQQAWQELEVAQCGYCQSGQIMSATGLLMENPKPTNEDIDDAMSGNVCRCATYVRIRQAIHRASEIMEG
ncbi:(2Fe-2S)-binding protein [Aestuariispira ectoiniformans]|uniref:(2Fe-2S)-binding protein n=1 Tax=Aestuariispira ectoiniformans TaxID=2775080 RepID=UPI00223B71CE|nr:(2Fe-2S)-binding protein [Aestuariispira ectoiniformans]